MDISGGDSKGHGGHVPHPFTNNWAWGHREQKNCKQETDQTVLTITKALTKTNNCTCRAKNVETGGERPKAFQALIPPLCPPTFQFVPAPLITSYHLRPRKFITFHIVVDKVHIRSAILSLHTDVSVRACTFRRPFVITSKEKGVVAELWDTVAKHRFVQKIYILSE